MDQHSIDRAALGEWDRDAWERNDPYSQETTREDWGEDWGAYDAAWQRVQAERQKEGWALTCNE